MLRAGRVGGDFAHKDALPRHRPILLACFALGSVESATVNCAVPPASVVVRPLTGVTSTAAVVTALQAENSDVSCAGCEAVAVTTWPSGTVGTVMVNVPSPAGFVVTSIPPRNVRPSG